MQQTTRTAEVNQAIRVNILRFAFLLCLPLILFSGPVWPEAVRAVVEVIGLTLVIAAVLGRFWAILYIGGWKNRTVMQDGPYSCCRHPLYFFSTLGVIGFGLMLGSVIVTLVLGSLTLSILAITARYEEAYLRGTFGPAYDEYLARVPMILPRLSAFRTPNSITVSLPHLRGNLKDALVFLLFIPLAELVGFAKEEGLLLSYPLI